MSHGSDDTQGRDVAQERETISLTNERGQTKQYETVASRVKRLRVDHPDWFIKTAVAHMSRESVMVRCEIGWYSINAKGNPKRIVLATGSAEEDRDSSDINRTSCLENAETSAIGRALAALGYMSTESYASAQEVQGAIAKQRIINDLRPGALVFLQNAAKKGTNALGYAWDQELTKEDRYACRNDLPALRKQAASVDREKENEAG